MLNCTSSGNCAWWERDRGEKHLDGLAKQEIPGLCLLLKGL